MSGAQEFPFVRIVAEPYFSVGAPAGYVVGAMMTASHAPLGERLSASCRAHSLPLALFEVPNVHRSISPKGSDDVRLTKASFVQFLHRRYQRPVLYLDVDCVIAQRPSRMDELLAAQTDFAIFNWLAEEHTEAYVLADITVQDESATRPTQNRFYRFSHSVDWSSDTQLFCSGAVQWYRNSASAARLLEHWQRVIERAPGTPDDKCLDYAFNNFSAQDPELKTTWLEKRYARYAWWIYERPVIDHPEFPHSGQGFRPLELLDGKPRIPAGALKPRSVKYVFPKPCLIDTQTRTLFRLSGGTWHAAGAFTMPLWLPASAPSPNPPQQSPSNGEMHAAG
jgi:hypothetical protein